MCVCTQIQSCRVDRRFKVRGSGKNLRPDDEIATAIARSLRRRQCAALCAKIRLHVTRLMESARFYCNRKLFCARRLRLSYRTSHMLTREEERRGEGERGRSLPRLAKFSPILFTARSVEPQRSGVGRFISTSSFCTSNAENLNVHKSLLRRV